MSDFLLYFHSFFSIEFQNILKRWRGIMTEMSNIPRKGSLNLNSLHVVKRYRLSFTHVCKHLYLWYVPPSRVPCKTYCLIQTYSPSTSVGPSTRKTSIQVAITYNAGIWQTVMTFAFLSRNSELIISFILYGVKFKYSYLSSQIYSY